MEVRELLQGSRRNESVVGVIIDNVCAEHVKCLVVSLRCEALHESICITVLSYAVYDLTALVVLDEHVAHRTDIVLSVIIDRDRDVAVVLGFHETCGNRILVASVTGQRDALYERLILVTQLLYRIPGVVSGSVINE